MAIYLDHQTRPYLERLINKQIKKSDKDFIAKRIKNMLESDCQRLQQKAKCKHEFGEYVGKKQCCVKCEAYGIGTGASWKFYKKLTKEDLEKMEKGIKEFTENSRPEGGRLFP